MEFLNNSSRFLGTKFQTLLFLIFLREISMVSLTHGSTAVMSASSMMRCEVTCCRIWRWLSNWPSDDFFARLRLRLYSGCCESRSMRFSEWLYQPIFFVQANSLSFFVIIIMFHDISHLPSRSKPPNRVGARSEPIRSGMASNCRAMYFSRVYGEKCRPREISTRANGFYRCVWLLPLLCLIA